MLLNVVAKGIVIGQVDLPQERAWSGGLLVPSQSYEAVGPLVRAATRDRELALRILTLALGELPRIDDLDPALGQAVLSLADQLFELTDMRGRIVQAEVVRIADPGDREQVRGVRVRAQFRLEPTGVLAAKRTVPSEGQHSADETASDAATTRW
jgi:hypothetical protein